MRMMPSWLLFGIIMLGGAAVLVANTLYPLAKAAEDKIEAAKSARQLLLPEIARNKEVAAAMRNAFSVDQVSLLKLEVNAWETVSKGNLLLGLKTEEVAKFLMYYRLVYQANEYNAQVIDLSVGIRSALQNSQQTKIVYKENVLNTLKDMDAQGEEIK